MTTHRPTLALAAALALLLGAPAARAESGVSFKVDGGIARRDLYEIPFWGGEVHLGLGGRVGRGLRILGNLGVVYAKDDTALRLTQGTLGVLLEGNVAGPLFFGGGFDVGNATVRLRSRSPNALGAGLSVHVGVDIVKFEEGRAFFAQLRGAVHGFSGRGEGGSGPDSTGGSLGIGFRL